MQKNKEQSVKKNLIYNIIYQITITILPLITTPYLSRVVKAEGIGIYSYFLAIVTYFVYFAMLGISNYGNRSIAKIDDQNNKNKAFSCIYYFQIITSIIVIIAYLLFFSFFVTKNKFIAAIFIIQILSTIFDVSWLFFGLQEFKITATRQIIIRLLAFFSMFIFVKDSSDLWKYTLIMCTSTFLSSFSLWILAWRRVRLIKVDKKEVKKIIKPILILFIPIIATSVYRVMDKVMLGCFRTMEEVGYYENSEKLITISLGIIASFGAVMMPKISNLLSKNKLEKAKQMFNTSMEFALCIGMAITFGISSVAKEFVPIFFGNEFIPSINYSMLLTTTVPFITWAAIVRLLYLIPTENDKIYVISVVLGAVLNFIINLLLINNFGVYGAVIGTIVAETSVALYQTIKVGNKIEYKKHLKEGLFFLLIGLTMFVFVRIIASILPKTVFGLIVEIVSGGFVYIFLSFMYFYFTDNKVVKKEFNKILKKLRRKEIRYEE